MTTTVPQVRSTADLIANIEQGHTPRYLFFWGHQPQKDGSIGKTCFSQWFEAAFTVDGTPYATAEHFMMAEKARLFADEGARARILSAGTPAQAKKLGRGVQGFDEHAWNQARFEIVVQGNLAKFSQNPPLAEFLSQTGDRVLVEASPVDSIWGIGLAATDPDAATPQRWRGLNLLGFALMEVRAALAAAPPMA
ncbi:MAG TPA: NADAR family protein [Burkholderiaceae bacterium]|nr:NADAR family protein [Burkholderiaceae bacterium]